MQQPHGKITLGQMLDFRQKLVGQNGNVRLLQSGGVKNIYDLVGSNGARNELPDGRLQFFGPFFAPASTLTIQSVPPADGAELEQPLEAREKTYGRKITVGAGTKGDTGEFKRRLRFSTHFWGVW